MASTFDSLHKQNLLADAPPFLKNAVAYEVVMGSVAYGVAEDKSDIDVYGFCVPPKKYLQPFTGDYIYGFDKNPPKFDQYLKHHIQDRSKNTEYDLTIYNIVKYFRLVADNNPNMVDSLFVPPNCILHCNTVGNLVRESRHIFLHKGCWHKFKGYAYAQLSRMRSQSRTGKRKAVVEEYGYDLKFAYHVVRLLLEVEQLLTEQDLDLQRGKEQLKAIRQGSWSLSQVETFFSEKERQLEKAYADSKLPYQADETEIKSLLRSCINLHFSDQVLSPSENSYKKVVEKIQEYLREV